MTTKLPPPPGLGIPGLSPRIPSTMADVTNGAVLLDVDVEPVGVEVHGHHLAGPDDPALLRQVLLAEGLEIMEVFQLARLCTCNVT